MKILKFGGSSVGTPERINGIIDILKPRIEAEERLALVFSAFSGVTDSLIAMSDQAATGKDAFYGQYHHFVARHNEAAEALLGEEGFASIKAELDETHHNLLNLLKGINLVMEVTPRTMDYVLSFGERNSNFIIAKTLLQRGYNVGYLDARKIIKTNKEFGSAKVNFGITDGLIRDHFASEPGTLQIVTGFIASDVGGLTTTLGRGGSDYTAAILAGALNAEALEIWTDVDGVLTCDPRKVKKAFTLPSLSYAEAMEMSHFGAKVIYPPTIQPALHKGIPIYIKNTFNPSFPGTLIDKEADPNFRAVIKGITSLGNIALLRLQGSGLFGVPGVSARLFGALGKAKINVILISQASSEHSICFAVSQSDAAKASQAIAEEFQKEMEAALVDSPQIEKEKCVLAVVGEGMRHVPGVAGKLFESLGKNGINITAIAQGSSELNISFVIDKKDEAKALNMIHDSFFLSDNRRVNLFVVGTGLIGSAFLEQLKNQRQQLIDQFKLELNVVGLSNSKKMILDEEGVNLSAWKDSLEKHGIEANIPSFVESMKEMNLSNSVFIDNTADGNIPALYAEILSSNISLVTPNKIATSASNEEYKRLKKLAADRKIFFKYETNVGAGLPVISTIQNLINSGDKILKIQAVMSGSVSFIFNQFGPDVKFSDLVLKARELGYTEPDPREDLSGADVRRKIIILTRESGYDIESADVNLKAVLPDDLMDAPEVNSFLAKLPSIDQKMSLQAAEAAQKGEVLRYIGTMENGKASIDISSVNSTSPFYSLDGSDNLFVITTERYKTRPIIIRGPGAGAEVTAAGVFADVLMAFV
ncbi:MAG: bifunctional aspartate kinase/homoserine dehydrogenase I [Saprospiraceae bacterium]|nr:bifunctional aspartate kinase/homoserine dehydrogenase I [Saprospiraceae bacterium]